MTDVDLYADEDDRQQNPIFMLNGNPIPINLHRSLGRGGRNALSRKISDAGGNPYAPEDEAEVIICRLDHPIFKQLEFKYDHDRYKWVEPPSWVDICLMTGKYEHHVRDRSKKTTRRSSSRNRFTPEDDEHLVNFLALRIPFKRMGGRHGNGVYMDLCHPERASSYPWAARHTWQSWRERYKQHQDIFDPRIDHVVKRDPNPPKPGGKGQYVISRGSRRPLPLSSFLQKEEEEDEEDIEEGVVTASVYERPLDSAENSIHRPLMYGDDEGGFSLQDEMTAPAQSVPQSAPPTLMAANGRPGHSPTSQKAPGPSHQGSHVTMDPRSPHQVSSLGGAHVVPPQPTSSSEMPLDSQLTLIEPVRGSRNYSTVVPLGTDGTAAQSSRLLTTSEPQRLPASEIAAVMQDQALERSTIAHNTRSRRRRGIEHVQLGAPSVGARVRGRTQKKTVSTSQRGEHSHATPTVGNASLGEEIQVEEILHVLDEDKQLPIDDAEGSSSSGAPGSQDDDEDARLLRDANREMINRVARSHHIPEGAGDSAGKAQISGPMPNIDNFRGAATLTLRKATELQLSSLLDAHLEAEAASDASTDATPKASRIVSTSLKAAKKTAARQSLVNYESDRLQSQTPSEETTDSSFPPESTIAHDYKVAQSPFTPAQGTMAEEHIRSRRSKRRKGKGRVF